MDVFPFLNASNFEQSNSGRAKVIVLAEHDELVFLMLQFFYHYAASFDIFFLKCIPYNRMKSNSLCTGKTCIFARPKFDCSKLEAFGKEKTSIKY